MPRREVSPAQLYSSDSKAYSQAVIVNDSLFIAGQVGRGPSGELVGPDLESQARQAFENVGAILEEVDLGFDDVGKVRAYIVDLIPGNTTYRSVRAEFFDPPHPAGTKIGVDQLAQDELRIELDVEAAL